MGAADLVESSAIEEGDLRATGIPIIFINCIQMFGFKCRIDVSNLDAVFTILLISKPITNVLPA